MSGSDTRNELTDVLNAHGGYWQHVMAAFQYNLKRRYHRSANSMERDGIYLRHMGEPQMWKRSRINAGFRNLQAAQPMRMVHRMRRSIMQAIDLKHLFLAVLLLGLFLLSPLLPGSVMDAVFVPSIIMCAWLAGGKTRLSFIIALISAIAASGLLIFDLATPQQFLALIREPLGFLFTVAVIGLLFYCGGVILRSLLIVERVLLDEVIGTFNIYLIIGYLWSYIYMMVELLKPGSFQPQIPEDSLGVHFIYFSFITLTTVGFGDTVPTTALTQMLVILEAMIGQFYVAIVVAYLVSMFITHNLAAKNTNPLSSQKDTIHTKPME